LEYVAKLNVLKKLEGSALEAALKETGKEIDNATIPLLSKHELRTTFAAIKKEFDTAEKARKANESKEAVEHVKAFFEANPDASYYISVINHSGNSKALSSAITQVKVMSKAALLVSIDGEKASVAACIPKEYAEKGWSAHDWAKVLVDGVGGKVGGSQFAAQGSGSSIGLQDSINLAESFAKKLSLQ
jgi:alanyl-tRNA synthetase